MYTLDIQYCVSRWDYQCQALWVILKFSLASCSLNDLLTFDVNNIGLDDLCVVLKSGEEYYFIF